jgi:hypothetical protein
MPLVKLKIRHEPIEVDDDELVNLRQQGLIEAVLDEPEAVQDESAADGGNDEPAVRHQYTDEPGTFDAGETEEQ